MVPQTSQENGKYYMKVPKVIPDVEYTDEVEPAGYPAMTMRIATTLKRMSGKLLSEIDVPNWC